MLEAVPDYLYNVNRPSRVLYLLLDLPRSTELTLVKQYSSVQLITVNTILILDSALRIVAYPFAEVSIFISKLVLEVLIEVYPRVACCSSKHTFSLNWVYHLLSAIIIF